MGRHHPPDFRRGVHEIRGVQRRPRDARWRKEALEAITATPWNRAPAAEGELAVLPPLAAPAAAQGAAGPEEVREPEYNPHRVYIKLEDLERHGFMPPVHAHAQRP